MTPENFCYWLQGLLEIGGPSMLDAKQVLIIKDHLNLVFKKETKIEVTLKEDNSSSVLEYFNRMQEDAKRTHNQTGDFVCATPAQIREMVSPISTRWELPSQITC
jgi:hypothetical protein